MNRHLAVSKQNVIYKICFSPIGKCYHVCRGRFVKVLKLLRRVADPVPIDVRVKNRPRFGLVLYSKNKVVFAGLYVYNVDSYKVLDLVFFTSRLVDLLMLLEEQLEETSSRSRACKGLIFN